MAVHPTVKVRLRGAQLCHLVGVHPSQRVDREGVRRLGKICSLVVPVAGSVSGT